MTLTGYEFLDKISPNWTFSRSKTDRQPPTLSGRLRTYETTTLATSFGFLLAAGYRHPLSLSSDLVDFVAISDFRVCCRRLASVCEGIVYATGKGVKVIHN